MTAPIPMIVSMIVAMSTNRIIGRDNDLPWRLSEDLKFFKRTTMGKPIIMGRKTYESIGKPLPGRTNIVVSRNENYAVEGLETVLDIESALKAGQAAAAAGGADEVVVIGGSQIYKAALPLAKRLYLTEVELQIEGDASFPELGQEWREVARSEVQVDAKSGTRFTFVTLERA